MNQSTDPKSRSVGPFLRSRPARETGAISGVHDIPLGDALVEFRARVAEAGQRVAELRGAGGAKAGITALDREQALAELDTAWEELETADEELRVQSDELALATGAIHDERARYQELFDFAPDPYVVTDKLGKIVGANRASTALFNVPAHKLPGRFLVSFVRLGERGAFRERITAILRGNRAVRWECTLAPLSSREPPPEVAVAVTAAPDRSGGIVWTLRDVTEKKRDEARLASHNEELERRVLERTRELEASRRAVEELLTREREARREAERAGREREEFVTIVSHELRSPLHAVLGWAKLASEGGEPEALCKALRVIERNARSMVALVDDLLDAARIDRGELSLRKERLDLVDVLASVCTSFAPDAEAHGVAFAFEPGGPGPALVDGDRVRLEQVFSNLLANALKFTPAGGRVVALLEREGERVLVRVRDTGRGIAPALLPHVFERFRQGEGGPQGPQRGLGLGLAIARHVAASHGGTVTAESEGEGRGATFTVCLPLAHAPAATASWASVPEPVASGAFTFPPDG